MDRHGRHPLAAQPQPYSGGPAGATSCACEPTAAPSSVANRMDELAATLAGVESRLCVIRDKVFGCEPSNPESNAKPGCLSEQLNLALRLSRACDLLAERISDQLG